MLKISGNSEQILYDQHLTQCRDATMMWPCLVVYTCTLYSSWQTIIMTGSYSLAIPLYTLPYFDIIFIIVPLNNEFRYSQQERKSESIYDYSWADQF